MPRRRENCMILISVHVPCVLLEWLDKMVKQGRFPNRSEAIRYALQRLYETFTCKRETGTQQ